MYYYSNLDAIYVKGPSYRHIATVYSQLHISRLLVYKLHVHITTCTMVSILAMMMICTGLWVTGNDSLASLNGLKLKITFGHVFYHSNMINDNSVIHLFHSLWLKENLKRKLCKCNYEVSCRMAKDPRFDRLPCMHRGTYADDCIVNRIQQVVFFFLFLPTYHLCKIRYL